jgi:hypothetical protein
MSSLSLMHRVFPPSKPPDGGYPPSFRLIVGGTQLRGSWYLSAIVRLQGFSSCSPVAPLRWWSPKTVTSSSWMGRGKPGCDLDPALSVEGVRHPRWGGERGEPELYLLRGSAGHLFFQLLVVANAPPALRRRRPPAMPGKANCCCPARMQHSALFLAFAVRTAARTCRCAWERPLFGFNSWFASLEREREREPSGGRVHLGPWLLLQRSLAGPPVFVAPQARGCSYPRGRNQSSVCNGTLNASVFVHCGCRGLNMYVTFGTEPCFFLIFEH